jgi:hypothetical protein
MNRFVRDHPMLSKVNKMRARAQIAWLTRRATKEQKECTLDDVLQALSAAGMGKVRIVTPEQFKAETEAGAFDAPKTPLN